MSDRKDSGETMRKYMPLLFAILLLTGCHVPTSTSPNEEGEAAEIESNLVMKQIPEKNIDVSAFSSTPSEWGEDVTGVKNRFNTSENKIALTFDACGGDYGSGYDEQLITFLQTEQIPATLFVNQRWIIENEDIFTELANNPLFQIENHGTAHAPLSVNGGEAWGIAATNSPEEVVAEIMENHQTVADLTGREMTLFRSGTAFYDEVAVAIANALGYEVVNFDILGDAGATYSSDQVKTALLGAQAGSIVLLHMNQPTSGTAEGVAQAVPLLREKGFEFVPLNQVELE